MEPAFANPVKANIITTAQNTAKNFFIPLLPPKK
jgi:hypothetical protein